ncbi:restriction endonuclease subunit S [Clostridium botulinum]|nr:restriction endonuclease subunit S [Clostridium botulinum]NFG65935.1 restriction endonuclease subunit S [Clostridium botulinum]NFQ25569.1 restriction endonuclease subunit S [Clostridium botulinum]
MKDSGVEWIGEIPEDWSIKKLKFVANIKSGEGITNNELSENGEFEVFGGNGVMGRCNKYNVECSRLIIGRVGALCGNVRYVTQKAYVSDNALILDLKDREIYKFYYYLLHGANLGRLNTSNAQPLITGTKVLNLYIPNINMKSQFKIAAFLDKKCTKIDQTIEKEKQVIEKLKEYKQSVITEAVTKGLNPDAPMKDSGVEWIGEIPEHWRIIKVKHVCNLSGRIGWQGLTSAEYKEEGPYLITGTDFKKGVIDWNTCVHITEERYEEAKQIQIKNNDLLITKDGTIGKVAIVSNLEEKASLNGGVLLIRPIKPNIYITRFMYYILLSRVFWMWFESTKTGNSTIIHLYQEKFKEFSYTLPLIDEQQQIADYLDKKCSAIDKIILTKEKIIEKLTEYKKSLIYECVTGKKEV